MISTKAELSEAILLHNKWRHGEPGGVKLVCQVGSNLSNSNLSNSNLSNSDLSHSDLRHSNLHGAWLPFCFAVDPRGYGMAWRYLDGELMFKSGCRKFAYDRAKAHWLSPNYPDPIIGQGKMAIIDCIVSMFYAGLMLVQPN